MINPISTAASAVASAAPAAPPAVDAIGDVAISMAASAVASAAPSAPPAVDAIGDIASYAISYTPVQTAQLSVDVPVDQLFAGAQLMIDALASPYMLIAGIGLGVAILAAILSAIRGLRI